jgi:mRNA interferase HicA
VSDITLSSLTVEFFINKKVYTKDARMKQREFQRWLARQGATFVDGANHLKVYLNGRQTVMPRHPGKELNSKLRHAIIRQLDIREE